MKDGNTSFEGTEGIPGDNEGTLWGLFFQNCGVRWYSSGGALRVVEWRLRSSGTTGTNSFFFLFIALLGMARDARKMVLFGACSLVLLPSPPCAPLPHHITNFCPPPPNPLTYALGSPATAHQFARTGTVNPVAFTNLPRSNPSVDPTCARVALNPAGVSYSRLT